MLRLQLWAVLGIKSVLTLQSQLTQHRLLNIKECQLLSLLRMFCRSPTSCASLYLLMCQTWAAGMHSMAHQGIPSYHIRNGYKTCRRKGVLFIAVAYVETLHHVSRESCHVLCILPHINGLSPMAGPLPSMLHHSPLLTCMHVAQDCVLSQHAYLYIKWVDLIMALKAVTCGYFPHT